MGSVKCTRVWEASLSRESHRKRGTLNRKEGSFEKTQGRH